MCTCSTRASSQQRSRGAGISFVRTQLSSREIEVIGLIVDGLSNKEIAKTLHLGEQTVKNHAARIMKKLDVRNRVELVLYAVRERLV